MTHRPPLLSGLLVGVLLVAACSSAGPGVAAPTGGAASVAPSQSSAPPDAPSATAPSSPAVGSPAPSVAATVPPPTIDEAWAQAELTDVATGQSFRIADLAGKTIIVETMAIWCTNCRAQQGEVYRALEGLDPDRVAYVLLDVDPNETGPALAAYRTRNGFTGTYAIAGRDVARALAADFGDQVLNPPSTPMILIGTDGQVTLTAFGPKSADTVVQLARDHGA